jgi:hypothetical protein
MTMTATLRTINRDLFIVCVESVKLKTVSELIIVRNQHSTITRHLSLCHLRVLCVSVVNIR